MKAGMRVAIPGVREAAWKHTCAKVAPYEIAPPTYPHISTGNIRTSKTKQISQVASQGFQPLAIKAKSIT